MKPLTSINSFQDLAQLCLNLGLTEDFDVLCRTAVHDIPSILGIDRVGLWLFRPEEGLVKGVYGTDENGRPRDERHLCYQIDPGGTTDNPHLPGGEPLARMIEESKKRLAPHYQVFSGALLDEQGKEVGRGERMAFTVWCGRSVRAFLFVDNLISGRKFDIVMTGRLLVASSVLGQNMARIGSFEAQKIAAVRLEERIEKERKQSDLLEKQRQVSEAALTAKSRYFAVMNHELRTPLNSILCPLGLLRDSNLSTEDRELIQMAEQSGTQMLSIINNILDLEKIGEGKMRVRRECVRLCRLLEERLLPLRHMAEAKGLTYLCNFYGEATGELVCDAELIYSVVSNLISNAVKFTDQGSVELSVDASAGQLEIVVSDTGRGIPEDCRDQLYTAYEQLEPTNPSRQGTGLGLAICKELIDLMEGRIELASAAEQGSCFRVEIPILPA